MSGVRGESMRVVRPVFHSPWVLAPLLLAAAAFTGAAVLPSGPRVVSGTVTLLLTGAAMTAVAFLRWQQPYILLGKATLEVRPWSMWRGPTEDACGGRLYALQPSAAVVSDHPVPDRGASLSVPARHLGTFRREGRTVTLHSRQGGSLGSFTLRWVSAADRDAILRWLEEHSGPVDPLSP